MPFSKFCKTCNINCCEFNYHFDGLWVTESERSVIQKHLDRVHQTLKWERDGNLYFAKINGMCPFQSRNRPFVCEIWDDRPMDCRIYPIYFFP
jgi:Fe-S-cluster containining protein